MLVVPSRDGKPGFSFFFFLNAPGGKGKKRENRGAPLPRVKGGGVPEQRRCWCLLYFCCRSEACLLYTLAGYGF